MIILLNLNYFINKYIMIYLYILKFINCPTLDIKEI